VSFTVLPYFNIPQKKLIMVWLFVLIFIELALVVFSLLVLLSSKVKLSKFQVFLFYLIPFAGPILICITVWSIYFMSKEDFDKPPLNP